MTSWIVQHFVDQLKGRFRGKIEDKVGLASAL